MEPNVRRRRNKAPRSSKGRAKAEEIRKKALEDARQKTRDELAAKENALKEPEKAPAQFARAPVIPEMEEGFESDEDGEWNDQPEVSDGIARKVEDVPAGCYVITQKADIEKFIAQHNIKIKTQNRKNWNKNLQAIKRVGGFMYITPEGKLVTSMPKEVEKKLEARNKPGINTKEIPLSTKRLCSTLAIVVFVCLLILAGITFFVHVSNPDLLSFSYVRGYKDYYKILNLPRSVDEDELRTEYRKLARQWHPDRNPNCRECTRKFALIAEAYSVLSSPLRREHYDQFGRDPGPITEEDRKPDFRPRHRAPWQNR